MIHENRKLAISGTAGVLVACLIIASVVMAPWTSTTRYYYHGIPDEWLSSPLDVKVVISNLTEPLGVGSEGNVTIILTSTKDASDVAVQFLLLQDGYLFGLPIGIVYIEGNLANNTWTGDLKANVSMIFNARIKAVEVGSARIWVIATWYENEYLRRRGEDSIWILTQENNIQISHEPIPLPGGTPFEQGNDVPPIVWPNGTVALPP
jgi:hypothetical protein